MNLAKFLDLLETQQLHFSRLGVMSDKYEGALSLLTVEELLRGIEQGRHKGLRPIDFAESLYRHNQAHAFVNCWYLAEYESAAMWSYYSSDGIAVRSSVGRLVRSLRNEPRDVNIGKIVYGNFNDIRMDFRYMLTPVFYKRRSFEFEREVRAVVLDDDAVGSSSEGSLSEFRESPDAIKVEVELECLIDRVYVSPGRPEWFRNLVSSVVRRYGLDIQVETSLIDKRPNYR